jgi:predicted outer membrane repeat protein
MIVQQIRDFQMGQANSWWASHKSLGRSHHGYRLRRRLSVEQLEDRRMLATFTVTNLNDAAVTAAGDAPGTLRQAIFDANADAVADVIEFQTGLTGTITLSHGPLVISRALTINGPGAALLTVDASGNDSTPNSTLDDGNNTNDGDGSSVFVIDDGDFFAAIDVSISGVTLTGGDSTEGGAVRCLENLALADTVITENVATGDGGGIYMNQPLIETLLTVHRSTISNNSSGANGGGIAIGNPLPIEITESTLAFNQAHGDGGAIYHSSGAPLTITQSTISGNESQGSGGGTFNVDSGGPIRADLTIRHSIVTNNTSDSDQNGSGAVGGVFDIEMVVILDHAIIAGNTDHTNSVSDLWHGFGLDARFSLIGDGDTGTGTLPEAPVGMPDANGNLVGGPVNGVIDPMLGSLSDNGGPTQTHALLAGSPAIDAGDPAFIPPPTNDQRGAPYGRVVDGDGTGGARIDMGPFEFVPSAGPELPGDYNGNDTVDAADYVVWRKFLNTATTLPNDATPGVDDSDYGAWRMNFGNSLPGGNSEAVAASFLSDAAGVVSERASSPKFSTTAVDLAIVDLTTDRAAGAKRSRFSAESAERGYAFDTAHRLLLLATFSQSAPPDVKQTKAAAGLWDAENGADKSTGQLPESSKALTDELQFELTAES